MANDSIKAAFERMWQHIILILNGKSDIHPHPYAGSATEGGSATSAVKLDSSAGSVTQPIYFEGGKPKATTYTLEKSVPADAKFTDNNNQVTQNPKSTDGEYPILLRGINPATTQCTAGTSFMANATLNPSDGSLSINRESGTTIGASSVALGYLTEASGDYSVALGYQTNATGKYAQAEGYLSTASGYYSHAEGADTDASGVQSHAEGLNTIAAGDGSHAEGGYTNASGKYAHTEGNYTAASGNYSHAEGEYTIASSSHQHVQGKFNIEDTTNTYAHIVGNGDLPSARSNAHTLDWNGNAWFAGKVTIGTDNKELATKDEVANKAASSHNHAVSEITDFPEALPANGGNADTVDGKHASEFMTNHGDLLRPTYNNTELARMADLNRDNPVSMANTNYTKLMARGTSLNSADTTPAVNGAIAWTYK